MSAEWSPDRYRHHNEMQQRWGARLIQRFPHHGRLALDAGCGPGGSTSLLREQTRLERVLAVDNSVPMAAACASSFADDPAVTVAVADLARGPVTQRGACDAVFSVATFHWIEDQESLWANLAYMLKPGGAVVAEYGGSGNLATLQAVLGKRLPKRVFPTVAEATAVVAGAGLTVVDIALRPDPQILRSREELARALKALVLHDDTPSDVAAVAERFPKPQLDWVRLEVVARAAP